MSFWTKDRIDLLKNLWTKGYSASIIAEKIGEGATRNSVIGKSYRLNLQSRGPSKKSTIKINKENNVEVKQSKLSRKSRFKSLLLDKNFEPEKPTKLEDLTDNTCRWPIGSKFEPALFFCGRKPLEKFSYCKLHVLYAFQPKNAKEEDQISEEDIPKFIEKKIRSV